MSVGEGDASGGGAVELGDASGGETVELGDASGGETAELGGGQQHETSTTAVANTPHLVARRLIGCSVQPARTTAPRMPLPGACCFSPRAHDSPRP